MGGVSCGVYTVFGDGIYGLYVCIGSMYFVCMLLVFNSMRGNCEWVPLFRRRTFLFSMMPAHLLAGFSCPFYAITCYYILYIIIMYKTMR